MLVHYILAREGETQEKYIEIRRRLKQNFVKHCVEERS